MSKRLRLAIALSAIALAVGALLLLPGILRRMHATLDHPHMKSIASQLLESTKVTVEGHDFTIERVGPKQLHKVSFAIMGKAYEAIEQNPDKDSPWAKLAREGHKVVQFRDSKKRYIGVVVDGEPQDIKPTDADL